VNWVPTFIGMTVFWVSGLADLEAASTAAFVLTRPPKVVTLTKVRAQIGRLDSARPGSSSLCELGPDLRRDDGVLDGDLTDLEAASTAAIVLTRPPIVVTLTKVRAQIERRDSARLGSSSLCELGPDLHRDDGKTAG